MPLFEFGLLTEVLITDIGGQQSPDSSALARRVPRADTVARVAPKSTT
jgi:hypothetical protein